MLVGRWVILMAESVLLAAGPAAAVCVYAQVFRVDLYGKVFFDLRHHLQLGKGCLSLACGVER